MSKLKSMLSAAYLKNKHQSRSKNHLEQLMIHINTNTIKTSLPTAKGQVQETAMTRECSNRAFTGQYRATSHGEESTAFHRPKPHRNNNADRDVMPVEALVVALGIGAAVGGARGARARRVEQRSRRVVHIGLTADLDVLRHSVGKSENGRLLNDN